MEKLFNNPSYFFILFALLWVGICFLTSLISGWRELSSYYSYNGQSITRKLYMQSGTMRWFIGYNNCLTIGAAPEGFYLDVFFLFHIGHSPLFIPWREIKIKRKKILFGLRMLELRFNRAPAIPLVISQRLESFLAQAAGKDLPFADGYNEK